MSEEIRPVGYINENRKHCMININDPTLCNHDLGDNRFLQVVLTIENIIKLRNEINLFLTQHSG